MEYHIYYGLIICRHLRKVLMLLAINLNRTKVLNKISHYSRTVAYNIFSQFFYSSVNLFL